MPDHPPSRSAGPPATPPRPTPSRPSGALTGGSAAASEQLARARMLSEVMGHIVETSKAPPPRRQRGPWVKVSVIVVGMALTAYVWLARPPWVFGESARPLSPREQTANTRFALWVLAQRVDAYRAAHGALPARLSDVGDSLPDVSYRRVGASAFELRATGAGAPVVYSSGESADAFLGSAMSVVRHGAR